MALEMPAAPRHSTETTEGRSPIQLNPVSLNHVDRSRVGCVNTGDDRPTVTHPYWKPEMLPDGRHVTPGLGPRNADVGENVKYKFLGDPEKGPWIYVLDVPAGQEIPRHSHRTDRIEYLVEGEVEWQEDNGAKILYGPGTLTHVATGTFYKYRVLKDSKILICFPSRPYYDSK